MNNQDYRFSKDHRKRLRHQRTLRDHMISMITIMVCFVAFIFLGAAIPGLYHWFDQINPYTQFVVVIIPMAIFGLWRLRKML